MYVCMYWRMYTHYLQQSQDCFLLCISCVTSSFRCFLCMYVCIIHAHSSNWLIQAFLVAFPPGGNVTLIKTTLDWVPSESQLGDHFLCVVAVNSRDVFSAPLCAIFRVFGMRVQVSRHQNPHCFMHTKWEYVQLITPFTWIWSYRFCFLPFSCIFIRHQELISMATG